jgi:hypothetical protein
MIALLLFVATCPQGQHLSNAKCVADAQTVDPTFKRSARGWIPSCPTGTELIRIIRPDESEDKSPCFWGVAPMQWKSSQGEFQCRSIGALPKLQACPNE